MSFENDNRIVMTLDAGGTNFVFSAIRANREIVQPVTMSSNANDLSLCLSSIVSGFNAILDLLPAKPVGISFAFPGPADYSHGIIGDLGNLPAFRGGVALGTMLEDRFKLPVFINNDGDLFAYGEAISGLLPYINEKLRNSGSQKQYRNLLGITIGTGLGAGLVHNNELFTGDNDAASEIWLMRNKVHPSVFAEESASIRAVQRVYLKLSNARHKDTPSPKDIYEIAKGNLFGDKDAAVESFRELGEVVGDALANAVTLIDGIAVIGGGLANASEFFMDEITRQLNGSINTLDGNPVSRLEMKAFNLDDEKQLVQFTQKKAIEIKVPMTNRTILYDPVKLTGVGVTKLGTSKAVSLGAYAFALNRLDSSSHRV